MNNPIIEIQSAKSFAMGSHPLIYIRSIKTIIVIILISTLFGCADEQINGQIIGTPAPSSKFAKLQIGMSIYDVKQLIGQPDEQYEDFSSSGYDRRIEFYYKNEGQLTFDYSSSMANELVTIKVDRNATGYRQ
ncbi:MAG: hypothetical protein ABSB19_14350 [Methylomonas sp.]|jgi:hypothetical protein